MDSILEGSLVCWNSLIQGGPIMVEFCRGWRAGKILELTSNPSLHKWGIRTPERARILLNIIY